MRLWHESLIPYLPRQQLLGQHRECCALRGLGWGKPHVVVNYVFKHPLEWLWAYHMKIMWEMKHRGYTPSPEWGDPRYRGISCEPEDESPHFREALARLPKHVVVYPEHNESYLRECLDNLAGKGIYLSIKE